MADTTPTLAKRVERTEKIACLNKAIIRCTPGTKRGSRSAVWSQLTDGTRYDLAFAYCIDHLTCEQVREKFRARLVNGRKQELVTARQVDRWLNRVHDEFIKAVEADINARPTDPKIQAARGELDVLVPLLISDLVAFFQPLLSSSDAKEVDAKTLALLLRCSEMCVDAYKVHAQAEHHSALTDRIRLDLKSKLTKIITDKTRDQGLDKGELEESVLKVIDEAMLGKGATR